MDDLLAALERDTPVKVVAVVHDHGAISVELRYRTVRALLVSQAPHGSRKRHWKLLHHGSTVAIEGCCPEELAGRIWSWFESTLHPAA